MNVIITDVVSSGGAAIITVGLTDVDAVNEPMSTAEGRSSSSSSSPTAGTLISSESDGSRRSAGIGIGIGTEIAATPSKSTPLAMTTTVLQKN